jgi:DJ-1 family protein
MPKNIYVFLAEGFEETEAIGTIDLLRRAGLPTHIVTIEDVPHVTGAHGIAVQADLSIREVYSADVRALVLPGGLPGVTNLDSCPRLHELIHDAVSDGKLLAAICAAPSIYGRLGLLQGKEATAYPGFEAQLQGAKPTASPVVRSGNFITAKSAAYTFDFTLAIIEALEGKAKADEVASAIIYQRH